MAKTKKGGLDMTVMVLVIVGALNWGLISLNSNWNVIEAIFGNWPAITTLVYALIGLSGIWMLWKLFK